MTYKVPCSVCSIIVQCDTYIGPKFCGSACEALHARRNVPIGHMDYNPTTPDQERQHRLLRPMYTRSPRHGR